MAKVQTDKNRTEEFVRLLESGPVEISGTDLLDSTDKAILKYAIKLTINPGEIGSEDVNLLRAVGLDDLAIHDLCCVVGYFAFVNRLADGLGVELEPE